MENMLSAHPDLDAIYSISDTQTFGAVKAITAVHKDPIVVSFDAQPEALKDIKAGTVIDASVGQFPFKVGALAVKTAVAVAEGKTVAYERYFTPSDDTASANARLIVQSKPDVIYWGGAAAATLAAIGLDKTTPMVVFNTDLLAQGFVKDMRRPGGN